MSATRTVPLTDRLRSLAPELSGAEARVAALVLADPDRVVASSGREVASLAQTSEPVLFRLVQKLGLEGFRNFKVVLAMEQAAARTQAELGMFNVHLPSDGSLSAQAQSVMEDYAANLASTARLLAHQPLSEVVEALVNARLVTLLGVGSSLSVATLAENMITRSGIPCRVAMDSHIQLLHAVQPLDGHVVVAFSHSGETTETVEAVQAAAEAGAQIVAFTGYEKSSVTMRAHYVVTVPFIGDAPLRVGLVDAVLPYLMLLDVIAIRLGASRDLPSLAAQVEGAIASRKLKAFESGR